MGAAAAPIIGAGISAGAGLLGAGKAAKAQQANANAASGLYNAEEQAIQQLLGNYFKVAPTLEDNLLNFQQKQQPEIQQLANTMGASDQSLLQSIRSQVGGVANPGAMIGGLARQNLQNEMMTTQGMQSQLAGQDLTALETLANFVTAPMASSLGGLKGMGDTYANAAASYGNPWESAIGGIGNFIGMLGPKTSSAPNMQAPSLTDIYPGGVPTVPVPTDTSWMTQQSPAALGWGSNTDPYSTMGNQFAPGAVGPG